jgi:hypothetical protein
MSKDIKSSVIRKASFSADGDMTITFTNGKTYIYEGVSRSVFDGLLSADSAGRYFNLNINGRYPAAMVR